MRTCSCHKAQAAAAGVAAAGVAPPPAGAKIAITIPTATSEHLYLRLGDEYFESPGGHIRIFRPRDLAEGMAAAGFDTVGCGFASDLGTTTSDLRIVKFD